MLILKGLCVSLGVLCVLIGALVVLLDLLVPERIREVFSVGGDDDDDDDHNLPHGYFNSNFLEGVTIEGAPRKGVPMEPLTVTHLVVRV